MLTVRYTQGAELPDLAIEWRDRTGQLVPFGSIAHTFELRVGHAGAAAVLTKASGFNGSDGNPNVLIAWSPSNELNTIAPGTYDADLIATRSSDGKQRKMRFELNVAKPVG